MLSMAIHDEVGGRAILRESPVAPRSVPPRRARPAGIPGVPDARQTGEQVFILRFSPPNASGSRCSPRRSTGPSGSCTGRSTIRLGLPPPPRRRGGPDQGAAAARRNVVGEILAHAGAARGRRLLPLGRPGGTDPVTQRAPFPKRIKLIPDALEFFPGLEERLGDRDLPFTQFERFVQPEDVGARVAEAGPRESGWCSRPPSSRAPRCWSRSPRRIR